MDKEKGFVLLESVIAMAIFAIAMLGIIGLQINSIQTDGETSRKDAAVRLLNTVTELVECSDFSDGKLYPASSLLVDDPDSAEDKPIEDYIALVEDDEAEIAPWGVSSDGKASVFVRFMESAGSVKMKTVLIVASWNGVKSDEIHTLSRIMTKPDNFMQ